MANRGGRARAPEEFSLSFLDVICCGFGAIILLLMITKTAEPQIIEASTVNLEGTLVELQGQVFQIRGETKILNRDLNAKQEQLSDYEQRIAILRGQMANVKSRYDSLQVESGSNSAISRQLAAAKQALTEEEKRLLKTQYWPKNKIIAGIPVDSEYIIFIIDNSGSMIEARPKMETLIREILELYPTVKGFQVMNGMGQFMMAGYENEYGENAWILDNASARKNVTSRLDHWDCRPIACSNPIPGITKAINRFATKRDKRISIYVFGDDSYSTEKGINEVTNRLAEINNTRANAKPWVRIHAIGFSTLWGDDKKFSELAGALTRTSGGVFVGLTSLD